MFRYYVFRICVFECLGVRLIWYWVCVCVCMMVCDLAMGEQVVY